jgi:polyribonucleotide nucleotidyltransferase
MRKVMTAPNAELSPLVPKVVTLNIIPDKIGAIIGSGGKTIREITETTGTSIDIEPDGLVKIYGGPEAQIDLAIRWVKTLAGQIEKGAIFNGKVRRIVDFGIFVELVPGLDGLAHVSNLPRDIQRNFMQTIKVDDEVKVEVLDHDTVTGRTSLKLLS